MSENGGSLSVTVHVDVKNLEDIARRLDLLPAFQDGVQAAGQYLKGIMQEYPPATESNRPGRIKSDWKDTKEWTPLGYYERGKGYWHPVKQLQTFASGDQNPRNANLMMKTRKQFALREQLGVAGFKLSRTSETMGRRWAIRAVDNRLGCIVGNNASYARYVHDKTKQAKIHGRHGWQTIQDVADRESKKVAEIITDFMIAKLRERTPGITALPT